MPLCDGGPPTAHPTNNPKNTDQPRTDPGVTEPAPSDCLAPEIYVGACDDVIRMPALTLSSLGLLCVLAVDPTVLVEQQGIAASDGVNFDWFGGTVSLSGDTAAIGAAGDGDGSMYVVTEAGGVWSEEQKLTAWDEDTTVMFGASVSVDGDTAIAGTPGTSVGIEETSGFAYVFTRSGGVWTGQQKLTPSDGESADHFGDAVSVEGDTAAVSAPTDDDNGSRSGSVYVFTRAAGVWTEEQKLTASDAASSDVFGRSVDLSGDTLVVGAPGEHGFTGAAYVFTRTDGAWTEEQKLTASDAAFGDELGSSIGVDGDTVIVGAWVQDGGAAYVFVRADGVWSEEAKLTADDGEDGDDFGFSVSVDQDLALIGAPDGGPFEDGAAYLFSRAGGVWNQQQRLVPDAGNGARSGSAVSLWGTTALVGAIYGDGNVNGTGTAHPFALTCGDGALDAGETCDDAGESAACDLDCTPSACGDGEVNATAGETCDDAGETLACDADCTLAACGDGEVNVTAGETCDDAGETLACDADCTLAACGDGEVNVTAGEACDDAGETSTCDADCTAASCGDGTVNAAAGEDCDDGSETMACDADCTVAVCGDGVVNTAAGEVCDDAGKSAACNADCTPTSCGDGYTNAAAGEDCDDAGESATCDANCTEVACGDGTLNATAGEDCDDGNTEDGDGCDATCRFEDGGSSSDGAEETGGGADTGGTGGGAETGGEDAGESSNGAADETGGDGGASAGGDDAGETSGAADPNPDATADGCSCAAPGQAPTHAWTLALLLLARRRPRFAPTA